MPDVLKNVGGKMDQEEPEKIEVCGICGSPDIEVRMWVNVNTNEVKSSCDDNETYCNICEEIIRLADLTTLAKYKEKLAKTPLDSTVLGSILNQ